MEILKRVQEVNEKMPPHRTIEIIALKAGEELGELNEAILVKGGHKSSKRYEDLEGIVGEAIDVALCALSIALKEGGMNEVERIFDLKMKKWEDKTKEKK